MTLEDPNATRRFIHTTVRAGCCKRMPDGGRKTTLHGLVPGYVKASDGSAAPITFCDYFDGLPAD
jgi:hypothetical protein